MIMTSKIITLIRYERFICIAADNLLTLQDGKFCMLFMSSADFFFKINTFSQQQKFMNTIRVSNSLDPDQI